MGGCTTKPLTTSGVAEPRRTRGVASLGKDAAGVHQVPESVKPCLLHSRTQAANRADGPVKDPVDSQAGASGWINALMERLWPNVCQAVVNMVKEEVAPAIQEQLPAWLAGHVRIDRFHLGRAVPSVHNLRCHDTEQGLRIEVHFDFDSGVDVAMSVGPIQVGISKLKAMGNAVLEVGPLLEEIPVIGAIDFHLKDPPHLEYEFLGIARGAELPVLKNLVRQTIDGIIAREVVLPNRIVVPIAEGAEAMLHDREKAPLGVLRVRAVSADNLKDSDFNMSPAKRSDPYLRAKLGDQVWTSSAVKGTCEPKWPSSDVHDFVVYDRAQALAVEVLDYDFLNSDDYMGCIAPIEVQDLLGASEQELPLFEKVEHVGRNANITEDPGKGKLRLHFTWLNSLRLQSPSMPDDLDGYLLTASIRKVMMPARLAKSVQVCLKVGCLDAHSRFMRTPAGKADAAIKGADKTLVGVVHRGGRMGLGTEELVKLTHLDREIVEHILEKDGRLKKAKASSAPLDGEEVDVVLDFDARLRVAPKQKHLEDGAAELRLMSRGKKVLASGSLDLKEMGTSWPACEPKVWLELKGSHGVVCKMEVHLNLAGLKAGELPN